MRYTYELFDKYGARIHITTRVADVANIVGVAMIHIFDNTKINGPCIAKITGLEDWEEWCDTQARAYSWSDKADKKESTVPLDLTNIWYSLKTACPPKNPWAPFNEQIELTESNKEATKKDAINPDHYQAYCKDMQWLETMQHLPRYKGKPEVFLGALELQVRKYLDRNGKKDKDLQELKKAAWYLQFMTRFIENGYKPITMEQYKNGI